MGTLLQVINANGEFTEIDSDFLTSSTSPANNITIINKNTILGKAQIVLPALTKKILLRSQVSCSIKLSVVENGSYLTIKPNCTIKLDGIELTDKILYIETSVSVTTIEALITHG